MSVHGYIRMTGDIDILISSDNDNAGNIYSALKEFGAPLSGISADEFTKPGLIFQIGVSPVRIDIINVIDGVDTDTALSTAEVINKNGIDIPFLSIENIIKNKRSTGRMKDLADAEEFEKIIKGRP
jgi:hypothetical protein